MTKYAIGDVQGCYQRALDLIDCIQATTSNPELVFMGDLVNRGPDSLDMLRKVRALGNTAQMVLGNHDLHLLATAHHIRKPHPSDTLNDILAAPDRDALLDWLRQQPLARFDNGYLFVHAGVLPQWTAAQTLELAHEVETVLRGPHWLDFLREMYGNTPAQWNDTLTGIERLRCIVNALTRMRFCTNDGIMEFTTKEGTDAALAGYGPWFDVPGRKTQEVTVVFGHWSALGLVMRPNLIGLDTGCVWGGKLTAVRLSDHPNDRQLIQVECPQYQRPGKA